MDGRPAANECRVVHQLLVQCQIGLNSLDDHLRKRGAHAREDYPNRDDKDWMKHTICWLDDKGKATMGYRPVVLTSLTNEVQAFPPKARVY